VARETAAPRPAPPPETPKFATQARPLARPVYVDGSRTTVALVYNISRIVTLTNDLQGAKRVTALRSNAETGAAFPALSRNCVMTRDS
jgi:hypothetical protein